jgi:hypothetical protein
MKGCEGILRGCVLALPFWVVVCVVVLVVSVKW